jgi:galactose mutarotase-like enzyme
MPSTRTPPTGAQHVLTRGEQTAVVTETGATLRDYRVGDRLLVDGFPEDARPDGGRGQVLAPWPNRVRDGRYTFDRAEQQLAVSEVAAGNAIHGLVRWVGWVVAEQGADRVSLRTTVWPQAGYPWLLRLAATYALDDDGLTVELTARNDGTGAAPYGVGQHPYLTAGVPADLTVLTLPASRRLLTDDRSLPLRSEDVTGTPYDFRDGQVVGDLRLDDAYVGLEPGPDGLVRVRLTEPRSRTGVELWTDAATRCVQVFSGDTLPDPGRRREGIAVEPMSCPADAFNSGTDLVVLEPGDTHRLRWGLRLVRG